MGIGTGLAVAGIAGGVASSTIGARAAGKAANTQAASADKSAQLQKEAADQALAFEKQQYEENKQRQAPWLKSGTDALAKLSDLQAFQAPGSDFTTDPGYQFRLAEGNKAIERSAAARGRVANPATQKALQRFNQNLASDEYGNVYGRRFNEYMNQLNQLQSRAGIGQTAVAGLNQSGQQTAASVADILGTGAARQGASILDAGTARASGYVGGANAISSGIGSTLGNLGQIYGLSQILKTTKKPTGGTLYDTGMPSNVFEYA